MVGSFVREDFSHLPHPIPPQHVHSSLPRSLHLTQLSPAQLHITPPHPITLHPTLHPTPLVSQGSARTWTCDTVRSQCATHYARYNGGRALRPRHSQPLCGRTRRAGTTRGLNRTHTSTPSPISLGGQGGQRAGRGAGRGARAGSGCAGCSGRSPLCHTKGASTPSTCCGALRGEESRTQSFAAHHLLRCSSPSASQLTVCFAAAHHLLRLLGCGLSNTDCSCSVAYIPNQAHPALIRPPH